MTFAQRQLLIGLLALMFGAAAIAADAPPADDKKDGKEAKAEAPALPDLPSKPYPKNATPKAFAPKAEPKKSEEAAAKPADKVADKPAEKPAEKAAEKAADKVAEKAADKPAEAKPAVVVHQPAHDKPATRKRRQAAAPAPKPVTDPALAALARESLDTNSSGGAYQVRSGDNLDTVIRKTMPGSPFSMEVMREAFARANPQLLATVKTMRLKPGTTLNVPNAGVMRQVVLGDAAAQAEPPKPKASELYKSAPVVAPSAPAVVSDQNPPIAIPRQAPDMPLPAAMAEVSPEEKKKWVRYP